MIDPRDYIQVNVHIEPFSEENAEIVEAMVSDLPYDSFEICEDGVKCYIQQSGFNRMALKAILAGLPFKTTFEARPVPFQNWNAQWEKTFEPIVVDGQVTIKQTDDKVTPRTRYNIRLRPEMAFGTGHHFTTYMMMQSMLAESDAIRAHTVLDMGCGTALLGILAAKMGAEKVYGIDIDAVAAQSAFDNARLNRVSRKVETYCGDASLLQFNKYDVILANIHRNIIIMDLRTYARALKSTGVLMLSGFYESDIEDIMKEAGKYGLTLVTTRTREGWACLTLRLEKDKKVTDLIG